MTETLPETTATVALFQQISSFSPPPVVKALLISVAFVVCGGVVKKEDFVVEENNWSLQKQVCHIKGSRQAVDLHHIVKQPCPCYCYKNDPRPTGGIPKIKHQSVLHCCWCLLGLSANIIFPPRPLEHIFLFNLLDIKIYSRKNGKIENV